MNNAPALFAIATVLAGAWMMLQGQQQQGSGAGLIGTDTGEGVGLDLGGIMQQVGNAASAAPPDNPATISGAGLSALQQREGFAATPYPDHKGFSIGYGHLIKAGETLDRVTVAQALDLLATDVAWAVAAVRQNITALLTQAQFDALTSFAYNVGAGAFARSTLVKRINAGDAGASDEFGRWVYASGVVDSGLIARRRSEQSQFESASA